MTSSPGPDSTLTIEKLLAVVDAIEARKEIRWYATSEAVTPGKYFEVRPSQLPQEWRMALPEYWLLHPGDFAQLEQATRLIIRWNHIRDWKVSS